MFKIKICGVKSSEDARAAIDAGADAIGLNFYQGSQRVITVAQADQIVHDLVQMPASRVGVFVNATAHEIEAVRRRVSLGWLQLHGNEPPQLLGELPPQMKVIRVCRLDDSGMAAVADKIAACRTAGRTPDAVLIDATAPGQFGGTGRTLDWRALTDVRRWVGDVPWILAGGLTSSNVAEAIRIVRPDAVDAASGVESQPGKKDAVAMQRFVAAARQAFDQAGTFTSG